MRGADPESAVDGSVCVEGVTGVLFKGISSSFSSPFSSLGCSPESWCAGKWGGAREGRCIKCFGSSVWSCD